MNTLKSVPVILVMGVSGCGKSTIAKLLAGRLGWTFLEGDDFHTPESIAKMRASIPLHDAERLPWLQRIASALADTTAAGQHVVLACSALKRSYRQILLDNLPGSRIVYLQGAKSLIADRAAARKGHFMPVSLLDSQFADLEEPTSDEHEVTVSVHATPEETLADAMEKLQAGSDDQ